MPNPALRAWLDIVVNPNFDAIRIFDATGDILGWIDTDGVPQGSLAIGGGGGAGFGFATGAIVANSTGNTPANGFTLSNGSTETASFAPTQVTLSAPDNPGVIDLNSEAQPAITVGDAATIGASTNLATITPSEIQVATPGSSTSSAMFPSGEMAVTDASGNVGIFGAPNGAGLALDGAGGTSITLDGTVPSTTWDDGAGHIVEVNSTGISNDGPTWTSDSGVPSGTPDIGSFYSRTDGGVGSSFYVYNGAAWLAIA